MDKSPPTRDAVDALLKEGLSVIAIATRLGVSRQRVYQIMARPKDLPTRPRGRPRSSQSKNEVALARKEYTVRQAREGLEALEAQLNRRIQIAEQLAVSDDIISSAQDRIAQSMILIEEYAAMIEETYHRAEEAMRRMTYLLEKGPRPMVPQHTMLNGDNRYPRFSVKKS